MSKIPEAAMAISNESQPTISPVDDVMGVGMMEMMELYRKSQDMIQRMEAKFDKQVKEKEEYKKLYKDLQMDVEEQKSHWEAKVNDAMAATEAAERRYQELQQQGQHNPEESIEKWYKIVLLGLGKLVGNGNGKIYVYNAENQEN